MSTQAATNAQIALHLKLGQAIRRSMNQQRDLNSSMFRAVLFGSLFGGSLATLTHRLFLSSTAGHAVMATFDRLIEQILKPLEPLLIGLATWVENLPPAAQKMLGIVGILTAVGAGFLILAKIVIGFVTLATKAWAGLMAAYAFLTRAGLAATLVTYLWFYGVVIATKARALGVAIALWIGYYIRIGALAVLGFTRVVAITVIAMSAWLLAKSRALAVSLFLWTVYWARIILLNTLSWIRMGVILAGGLVVMLLYWTTFFAVSLARMTKWTIAMLTRWVFALGPTGLLIVTLAAFLAAALFLWAGYFNVLPPALKRHYDILMHNTVRFYHRFIRAVSYALALTKVAWHIFAFTVLDIYNRLGTALVESMRSAMMAILQLVTAGINSIVEAINFVLDKIRNIPMFRVVIAWKTVGALTIPYPRLERAGTLGDQFHIPDIPRFNPSTASRAISGITFNGPVYYLTREEIMMMIEDAAAGLTNWTADF